MFLLLFFINFSSYALVFKCENYKKLFEAKIRVNDDYKRAKVDYTFEGYQRNFSDRIGLGYVKSNKKIDRIYIKRGKLKMNLKIYSKSHITGEFCPKENRKINFI